MHVLPCLQYVITFEKAYVAAKCFTLQPFFIAGSFEVMPSHKDVISNLSANSLCSLLVAQHIVIPKWLNRLIARNSQNNMIIAAH